MKLEITDDMIDEANSVVGVLRTKSMVGRLYGTEKLVFAICEAIVAQSQRANAEQPQVDATTGHDPLCDIFEPGPQLGPSTKPCNCKLSKQAKVEQPRCPKCSSTDLDERGNCYACLAAKAGQPQGEKCICAELARQGLHGAQRDGKCPYHREKKQPEPAPAEEVTTMPALKLAVERLRLGGFPLSVECALEAAAEDLARARRQDAETIAELRRVLAIERRESVHHAERAEKAERERDGARNELAAVREDFAKLHRELDDLRLKYTQRHIEALAAERDLREAEGGARIARLVDANTNLKAKLERRTGLLRKLRNECDMRGMHHGSDEDCTLCAIDRELATDQGGEGKG